MSPQRMAPSDARPLGIRLLPLLIFAAFAALSGTVWRQLVKHRQALVARHAEDVCVQVSRRIQVLAQARLRFAEVFALRWSSHEERNFSHRRFEEFGGLLTRELPGFRALHLVRPDADGAQWTVPEAARARWAELPAPLRQELLAKARRHRARLSAPLSSASHPLLFAALRLERDSELLGYLVVEIDAAALIGAGFHNRIRAEFLLRVEDGDRTLFRFHDDNGPASLVGRPAYAERAIAVRNRTWRVTVAARPARASGISWSADLAVGGLGLLAAVGIALLVHLLARRMELYRVARDRALSETASREQAELELRESEARYRSVFDSTTDGLLVIDDADRVVEANPAAARMHGYEHPAALARLPVVELIHPDHRHLYDEFKRELASQGSTRLDSVGRRSDGSSVELEVRGTFLDRPRGEARALAILTDVTHRRQALQRQALLARKALLAQEEERARVSRELHDELGQILTAVRLEVLLLQKEGLGEAATREGVATAMQMITQAADELRRVCKGLRPPLLDDLGLEPAVRSLVDEFAERSGVRVDLEVRLDDAMEGPGALPGEVALGAYRVLQESLNNVRRHAEAREVNIALAGGVDEGLLLSIYDDGKGFERKDEDAEGRYGIAGMRERAALVGGDLQIRSVPGEGTRVVFRVPGTNPKEQRR